VTDLSESKKSKKTPTGKSTTKPQPTSGHDALKNAGPMSVGLLEQIVKLMAANDLNTVDLRDGDQRVVLKRGTVADAAPVYHQPAMHSSGVVTSAASSASQVVSPAQVVSEDAGTVAIKSPMVGTFYARPTPDAKAFVNVGTLINEETDVCIIEAMKVFNNIKAEVKGTVTKVLAEDGKPVEFGQVLFLVKPS
jgi:acetyl-CoA carboxylase biotin carboxyl carrier protein